MLFYFVLVFLLLFLFLWSLLLPESFVRFFDVADKKFSELTFFQKYIISFFPFSVDANFNAFHKKARDIRVFRETYFPDYTEKLNNLYFSDDYKITLKQFNKFSKIFFKKNIFFSKNIQILTVFSKKNNFFFNSYFFLFFIYKYFYKFLHHIFAVFFFENKKSYIEFDLIFFIFIKRIFVKKLHTSDVKFYKINDLNGWYNFTKKLNEVVLEKKNITSKNILPKNYAIYIKNLLMRDHVKYLFKKYTDGRDMIMYLYDFRLNFNDIKYKLISLKTNFNTNFKSVIFSESSTNKYVNIENNFLKRSPFLFFFIRKIKIFNKGRYSRNRQTYRTGFYWCLWVNILAIYGLHYICYRFTFTFGFLWVPFIIFFGLYVFSRMLKYNFFDYTYVLRELNLFQIWLGLIVSNFFQILKNFFNFCFNKLSTIVSFNRENTILSYFYEKSLNFYDYINNYLETLEYVYLSDILNQDVQESK